MVRLENECVGCPPEMGCLGSSCPNRAVPNFYCDDCGHGLSSDELYDVDGNMLCSFCALKRIKAPAENWME